MQLILCFFHGCVGPNSRLLPFICYWRNFHLPIRRFDSPTLARRLQSSSSSLGLSPAVMGDESHGSGGRQRRSSRPLISMQRGEGFPFSDGDYIISTPPPPPPRIPLRRSCGVRRRWFVLKCSVTWQRRLWLRQVRTDANGQNSCLGTVRSGFSAASSLCSSSLQFVRQTF